MIIFLLFQLLFAGEVKITPEIVNVQSLVTIEYKLDPEHQFHISKATPILTAYFFDKKHSSPVGIDYQGELIGGDTYKYTFRIDTIYNFVLFKFSDGLIDDNNKQQFWDIVVHQYDKPVKDTYLKKALSYLGSMPQNINRLPDLKVAENLLKRELELFPDNVVAQIALVQVKFDQGFLKEDAYKDELKYILNKELNHNDETVVRAVSRALKTVGMSEKANEIELEFGKKYPKTELSQELILAKLSEAEDMKSFVDICEFYLNNYEDSPQKEKIMLALVSAYLQNGNYFPLMKKLENYEFIYPSVYSKIGMELSELSKTRGGLTGFELKKEIISNYRRSIKLIDSLVSSESQAGKPRYFTTTEQKMFNYFLTGSFRQGLGEFYLEMMELDSAEHYLTIAANILEDKAESSLYNSLIELYKLKAETKKVIEIAEKSIINTSYNDTIINIYSSLKTEDELDSLYKLGQEKRLEKLKLEEIDYKVFSGLFKTTDEQYKDIESDSLNYKIVTFFSTWCGPCQAMVDALEEIEGVIKDSTENYETELYSINAWENPTQRDQLIAEFLDEYDPKYTILIDETSIIPQKYGVTGLPVTFILDKNSKIKFKIEGYESKADFLRKCLDRIEYLQRRD